MFQWVSGCLTAIVLCAVLVLGPTACVIDQQRETTKVVDAACAGSLKDDAARAAACALAVQNARVIVHGK